MIAARGDHSKDLAPIHRPVSQESECDGLKGGTIMAEDKKKKKCAHPSCDCFVQEGKYCSQYCKDAGGTMEISCNCRHAECGIEAAAASA
jgi:hypothetical protein